MLTLNFWVSTKRTVPKEFGLDFVDRELKTQGPNNDYLLYCLTVCPGFFIFSVILLYLLIFIYFFMFLTFS